MAEVARLGRAGGKSPAGRAPQRCLVVQRSSRETIQRSVRPIHRESVCVIPCERDRHAPVGPGSLWHRVWGRSDRSRPDLAGDSRRGPGYQRGSHPRGRRRGHLVPRSGPGRRRDHAANEGHYPGAPLRLLCRHGRHPGHRTPAQSQGDRRLRPQARRRMEGPKGRRPRRHRQLQFPAFQADDRRRGRRPDHQRPQAIRASGRTSQLRPATGAGIGRRQGRRRLRRRGQLHSVGQLPFDGFPGRPALGDPAPPA